MKITIFKKLILTGISICISFLSFTQGIQNGNFEDNLKLEYKKYGSVGGAVSFYSYTNNFYSLSRANSLSVEALYKHGGVTRDSGIIIRNVINGQDSIVGFLTNTAELPFTINGGCAIMAPFDWDYKVNLVYSFESPVNDTAYMRIVYRKGPVVFWDLEFPLTQTNGFTSTQFWHKTITKDSLPDYYLHYFRLRHPNSKKPLNAADVLKIKWIGTDGTSQTCDRYFNFWHEDTFTSPNNWYNIKGFHQVHPESNQGKGALALTGLLHENGFVENYIERNYTTDLSGVPRGGAAVNQKIDTLWGAYKYKGFSTQLGRVHLTLLKNNVVLLDTFQDLSSKVSKYTYFSLPYSLPVEPDTMRLEIIGVGNARIGDTLFLDEIQLLSAPLHTGMPTQVQRKSGLSFYPNPTTDILYPSNSEQLNSLSEIQILAITGKVVLTFPSLRTEFSVAELPAGIYFIKAIGKDSELFFQKFLKQ